MRIREEQQYFRSAGWLTCQSLLLFHTTSCFYKRLFLSLSAY